jgi:hypothetical protein
VLLVRIARSIAAMTMGRWLGWMYLSPALISRIGIRMKLPAKELVLAACVPLRRQASVPGNSVELCPRARNPSLEWARVWDGASRLTCWLSFGQNPSEIRGKHPSELRFDQWSGLRF